MQRVNTPSPEASVQLEEFLVSAFTFAELERLATEIDRGLPQTLPSGLSLEGYYSAMVAGAARRGVLGAGFWQVLQRRRPRRVSEILALATAFEPGLSAEASSGRTWASPVQAFVAHNSQDKPMVARLCHELLNWGVQPWLDIWELPTGLARLETIRDELTGASFVLVCIGEHGWGSEQEREYGEALRRLRVDPTSALLIRLPGADDSIHFGARVREVDLREFAAWGPTVAQFAGELAGSRRSPVRPVGHDAVGGTLTFSCSVFCESTRRERRYL